MGKCSAQIQALYIKDQFTTNDQDQNLHMNKQLYNFFYALKFNSQETTHMHMHEQKFSWSSLGFILARVVRVKNENGRKFTHKK